MLTLTRRVGEVINVGSDGAIVVLSIGGGQVKLGIEFPRAVSIARTEIAKGGPNEAALRALEGYERKVAGEIGGRIVETGTYVSEDVEP